MTEQINDQISAFIDNELPADESALLVRRFERDTEARARAMRYTLIGAALRGELLEPHPSVLRQRVAAALTGTSPSAPKTRERAPAPWLKPALGFGIAAAVAVVAIGALRSLNEPSFGTGDAVPLAVTQIEPRSPVEAPSYVVPSAVDDARDVTPPIRLTNYLMHHGVYASGLTRTSVSSNVLGAAAELVATETAAAKPTPIEQEPTE
jgi:sigma-E factor negative regulatory protein RseA